MLRRDPFSALKSQRGCSPRRKMQPTEKGGIYGALNTCSEVPFSILGTDERAEIGSNEAQYLPGSSPAFPPLQRSCAQIYWRSDAPLFMLGLPSFPSLSTPSPFSSQDPASGFHHLYPPTPLFHGSPTLPLRSL